MSDKKTIELTTELIKRIEEGSAPWQKPWKAGELAFPINGSTDKEYNGFNFVNLLSKDYNDPRWYTFKQANTLGHKIKKGERSTLIRFVKFVRQVETLDENGNVQKDAQGNISYTAERLDRPQVMLYNVFNATQLDGGLEPFIKPAPPAWDTHDRADKLIANIERYVAIEHNRNDKAFFDGDKINLPAKSSFLSTEEYYATVMHELAHWTRYQGKNEEQKAKMHSEYLKPEGRAVEEITAEMTSLLLCQKLGLDYAPQKENSLNYQAHWAKNLDNKNNSYAVYNAISDAEKRVVQILNLELDHKLEKSKEAAVMQESVEQVHEIATKKQFLNVPYADRQEAKALGAKWDKEAKSWYAPEGVDLAPLSKWQNAVSVHKSPALSPTEELSSAIINMGGNVQEPPIFDGKIHRVASLGGKAGNKDVSYCAFDDGLPAGWIHNFKSDQKINWAFSGHELNDEQKVQFKDMAHKEKLLRQEALIAQQNTVAVVAKELFDARLPLSNDHAYLLTKGVSDASLEGLKASQSGKEIIVPMYNSAGEIRSLQFIHENGFKSFFEGGEKKGNFFVVGCDVKELPNQSQILIAEGLATAQSINQAVEQPCIVAFDAGNMQAVANEIRRILPDAQICICADNDHKATKNIGVEKATEVAKSIKASVVIPKLTLEEKALGLTDFNDIKTSRGLSEVKKQIEVALARKQDKKLERAI